MTARTECSCVQNIDSCKCADLSWLLTWRVRWNLSHIHGTYFTCPSGKGHIRKMFEKGCRPDKPSVCFIQNRTIRFLQRSQLGTVEGFLWVGGAKDSNTRCSVGRHMDVWVDGHQSLCRQMMRRLMKREPLAWRYNIISECVCANIHADSLEFIPAPWRAAIVGGV